MLEIPNVLLGIQKMIQIRTPSKLQDVDVQMHMSKFYYTLAGILNHPNLPGTYHKARVITFNGEVKWLYISVSPCQFIMSTSQIIMSTFQK